MTLSIRTLSINGIFERLSIKTLDKSTLLLNTEYWISDILNINILSILIFGIRTLSINEFYNIQHKDTKHKDTA